MSMSPFILVVCVFALIALIVSFARYRGTKSEIDKTDARIREVRTALAAPPLSDGDASGTRYVSEGERTRRTDYADTFGSGFTAAGAFDSGSGSRSGAGTDAASEGTRRARAGREETDARGKSPGGSRKAVKEDEGGTITGKGWRSDGSRGGAAPETGAGDRRSSTGDAYGATADLPPKPDTETVILFRCLTLTDYWRCPVCCAENHNRKNPRFCMACGTERRGV